MSIRRKRRFAPKFDDKQRQEARHRSGAICHRRQGRDGLGHRRRSRPAQPVAQGRLQFRQAGFVPGRHGLQHLSRQNHGGWNSDDNQNNNLGRFRLSVTSAPDAVADPLPQNVREILAIPRGERSPAQLRAVFSYWRTTVPEWKDANDAIASIWHEYPEGAPQLVLNARVDDHRETHILKRGDFLKPDKAVEPGVPAFLHPLPANAPLTRLTFAKWLVDRKSPTTARSIVNRVWQGYFGTGIVGTGENFGTQCEPPSQPELLDWLAVEFMDTGWSLKKLHRTIVTFVGLPAIVGGHAGTAWRRIPTTGCWRAVRASAWMPRSCATSRSRPAACSIRGSADPASFRPRRRSCSSRPPATAEEILAFGGGPGPLSPRALHVPLPLGSLSGAADLRRAQRRISCVRRARSNTPLQALTTLNEPLFVEAARALALRTLKEGGHTDQDRIAYAFRRCVARPPTPRESAVLLKLLDKQKTASL